MNAIHQQQTIRNEGSLYKYFAMIPHIADEDLDPYEYKLYGHYVRVCGANNNPCIESERVTAEKCKMSRNKFRDARDSLAKKGYISYTPGEPDTLGQKGKAAEVVLNDMWLQNAQRFQTTSGSNIDRTGSNMNRSPADTGSNMNQKNKEKEEEEKEQSSVGSAARLWERVLGRSITPFMAEEIVDLIQDYGETVVVDALKEMGTSTERPNIKYLNSILARWQKEGRGSPKKLLPHRYDPNDPSAGINLLED